MNNHPRDALIILVGVGLLILILNTIGKKYDKRLKANHSIVCGNILGMRGGKGVNVIYEFYYKGTRLVKNVSSPKSTLENYQKGKKNILIIFEKDDPTNCVILSKADDYIDYNVKVEDTVGIACN